MRKILLAIAIILFLQGYLRAGESKADASSPINTPQYGLDVSLYSVNSKNPDYEKVVQEIRDGITGSSDYQMVYRGCEANAFPFYYKNEGSYPGSISDNISPDFRIENLEIRENFIVRWHGKILVPAGYFALRLTDTDDWGSVYIYRNQSKEKDKDKLSRVVPFVTTDTIFGRLVTYDAGYTYIDKEELLNIEIIFVQKTRKFSFNLEAIMGLTHKALQVTWGKKIGWLEKVYFEEQFLMKNGSWWKPVSEYADSIFSPIQTYEDYLLFLEMARAGLEPEEEQSEDCESCEEPVFEKIGFKGEFLKISSDLFPIQMEKKAIDDKYRMSRNPQRATPHWEGVNYWEKDCKECHFDTYFPDIINYAEDLLAKEDSGAPLVRATFYNSEDPGKIIDYIQQAIKWGNLTLDFNITPDNYANATADLPVYRFFKKAFDLLDESVFYLNGQSSLSAGSRQTKEEKKGANIVRDFYKKLVPEAQMPDAEVLEAVRLAKSLTRNDHFRTYLGPNLFWMGFTKFTGKMMLPSGSLKVKIDRGAKHAASVLVTDQPKAGIKYHDLNHLLNESVVYSFANKSAPYKAEGTYSETEGSASEVYIYVYFFHYAGPMKLKIQFDPDGKGYRDLSELEEYIKK